MPRLRTTQKVPLNTSKDGSIRIAGSRVGLEAIIHEFKNGATAEQIHMDFPCVSLRDIYTVIAYYLDNKRALTITCAENEAENLPCAATSRLS